MSAPIARVGGRVILLDPSARVLLIHERIDAGMTHWITPGGGVEAGEDPRAAAAREAMEEIGLLVEVPPGAAEVLRTRREWSWQGTVFDQVDHFFALTVGPGIEPRPAGLTEMEQETLLGYRWWSADELATTEENITPPELGGVVAGLVRDGVFDRLVTETSTARHDGTARG